MTARLQAVVLNASDPPALARFWAQVLGQEVVQSDADWAQLDGSLAFQSDPVPKAEPNRLHLDVRVEDIEQATATVVGLGAKPLTDVQGGDEPWRVFADPEGNEFCLVTG